MPIKLDGKALADRISLDLKARCDALRVKGVQPRLTIVTTGQDPASTVYIRNKMRQCVDIGIVVEIHPLDRLTRYSLPEICWDRRPIIFQMPMEMEADVTPEVLSRYVDPVCDVDGFLNLENVAALASGREPANYPCTPAGILRLLDEYGISLEGASVCVIGRSNLVGRPLARMLERRNATVTLSHSFTKTFGFSGEDVIISAVGNRSVLEKYTYFPGKILIDVGINRDKAGRLRGDFPEGAYHHCKAYTPVPGGVGPMTVAMLLENVIRFYERSVCNE